MLISRPTSLLAPIEVSVFSLQYLCYLPVDSHHQHKPEADVSFSISVPPGFPGPSEWHSDNDLMAVVIKYLLVLDHFGQENYQKNVYLYRL
jgi:hypothetical protein